MDSHRGSRAGSIDAAVDLPSVEDLSRISKKLVAAIDDEQISKTGLPPDVTAYFKSMMKMVNDYVYDQVVNHRVPIDVVMGKCVEHLQGFIRAGDHFSALAFSQALSDPVYQDALSRRLADNLSVAAFIKKYTPSSDPQQDYNAGYRLFENDGTPIAGNKDELAKIVVPYVNHFVTMSDRVNTKIGKNELAIKEAKAAGKDEVVRGALAANRELDMSLMALSKTFAVYRTRICDSLSVDAGYPKKIELTARQQVLLDSMTSTLSKNFETEVDYFKKAFADYLQNKDQPNADVKMFFALGNYIREKLGTDYAKLEAFIPRKYESLAQMLRDRKKFPFLDAIQLEEHCNAINPDDRAVMRNLLKIVSKFDPDKLVQSKDVEKQANEVLKQINQNLDDYQNAMKKEDMKKVAAVVAGKSGLSGLVDRVRGSRANSLSSPMISRRQSDASPSSSFEDTQSVEKSKSSSKGKNVSYSSQRKDSITLFGSRRDSKAESVDALQARRMNTLKVMVGEMNQLLQAGDYINVGIQGAMKGLWTSSGIADKEPMPKQLQDIVQLFNDYLEEHPEHKPGSLMSFMKLDSSGRDELVAVYNAAIKRLSDYASAMGFDGMVFPQHLYSDSNMLEAVQNNLLKFKLNMTETRDPMVFAEKLMTDIRGSKLTNAQKLEAVLLIEAAFSKEIAAQPDQTMAKDVRDYKQTLSIAADKDIKESRERASLMRRTETAIRDSERVHKQEVAKQEGGGWKRPAARAPQVQRSESQELLAAKKASLKESAAPIAVEPTAPVKARPVPPPKPARMSERQGTADVLQGIAKGDAAKAVEDARVAEAAARAAALTQQKISAGSMATSKPRAVKPQVNAATEMKDDPESKQTTPSMRKGSGSGSE